MVVMVTAVVEMLLRGSEHRAGKHHQKQYGCENLFHGINVARTLPRWVERQYPRIKRGNLPPAAARPSAAAA
jgi:hypothetical protein